MLEHPSKTIAGKRLHASLLVVQTRKNNKVNLASCVSNVLCKPPNVLHTLSAFLLADRHIGRSG